MTKLDKLLNLHKETTLTQELVDEYHLLKFEIESMEKENERLKKKLESIEKECDKITKEHAKLYLDNQHLNNVVKHRKKHAKFLTVQNKQLKNKLEIIQKEFEYGLPTSMKECTFICSKIYDILENKK